MRYINISLFLNLIYGLTRYFLYTVLSGLSLLVICALIPRKWNYYPQPNCDEKICISNTGIHSNIIIPIKNDVFDWHKYLSVDAIGIGIAKDYNYLSFGWGERDFYMSTPSLTDLKLSTTLKAIFLTNPSVLYVQGYKLIPKYLEVKCIKVTKNDYLQLMTFIQNTFQFDTKGRIIRIGNGHTTNAGFYAAVGSYSILKNCNSWTAEGLKKADVNTPLWDGLSSTIMWHLRSGCEY